MKNKKVKSNSFQTNSKKLTNGFAIAMNEPTLIFPDSDTLGGAAVLQDGPGQGTFQAIEPVYEGPQLPPKDPIISEVSIVPMENGGGIVKDIPTNTTIDTNMNPIEAAQPPITPLPDSTQNVQATESKSNLLKWIVIILIVVAVFYLIKKK